MKLYIGTSGWHYNDWTPLFYPPGMTGYNELHFHAAHFNTVENNASFYRVSKESTYKTWSRMTPTGYKFSMKLNKFITHEERLVLNDETRERMRYILDSTQVLQNKLGAIVIQLPASFHYDLAPLAQFLDYFVPQVHGHEYKFDIAIEFRNKQWFVPELYELLKKHNAALVYGQSSRYPAARELTSDLVYIRMHGPEKLFASPYSTEQLRELANYLKGLPGSVQRAYVYFNNDFHGYAIANAKELMALCAIV